MSTQFPTLSPSVLLAPPPSDAVQHRSIALQEHSDSIPPCSADKKERSFSVPPCSGVKIDLRLGLLPIKWEPEFFAYFGSLVARIKSTPGYDKADGDLLGIEGAAIAPPDPMTSPDLKVTVDPGGMPQLEVTKACSTDSISSSESGTARCNKAPS